MKKIITLMILLVGMVTTASATILHIGMEKEHSGTGVYVYREGGSTPDDWNNMGSQQQATYDGDLYGRRWYHIDMNGNTAAQVRFDDWYSESIKITGISGDNYYIYVSTTVNHTYENYGTRTVFNAGQLTSKGWTTMKFSNDVDNLWDDSAPECTKINDNTFTYTLTKSQIDAANKNSIYFRYKLADGVFFVNGSHWNDHYFKLVAPEASTSITIDANTSTVWHKTDWFNNWVVTVPSYNYEKLVFTIKDLSSGSTFNDEGTWQIRVDAYISKTISNLGYATFGSEAAVDFSGLTSSFTAKKGKVQSGGTISWTTTTTLAVGEGVLLEGTPGTYSIPVAASASADSNNDFKAIDKETQLDQTGNGKTNYILTNRIKKVENGVETEDSAPLGFYKVNSGKSWCGANTAYIATTISPSSSRGYFPIWDDATSVESIVNGIENTNLPVYDLQGRRIANPQKGLYIVNGKKVIK